MLMYDAFSSCISAVNGSALLRKIEQVERAGKALMNLLGATEEFDMCWWRACWGIEWLITTVMRRSDDESEWGTSRKDLTTTERVEVSTYSCFDTKCGYWM